RKKRLKVSRIEMGTILEQETRMSATLTTNAGSASTACWITTGRSTIFIQCQQRFSDLPTGTRRKERSGLRRTRTLDYVWLIGTTIDTWLISAAPTLLPLNCRKETVVPSRLRLVSHGSSARRTSCRPLQPLITSNCGCQVVS